jgi:hypothetical protein
MPVGYQAAFSWRKSLTGWHQEAAGIMAPRLLDVEICSIRPRRAVLVVEDAISVRSMLSEFFIGHGYEVLHARHRMWR